MVSPRFARPANGAPPTHTTPRHCPVCGEELVLTRLGCASCGTELSGSFEACEFCALSPEDREILRVFLASRGNMKDLERHLGVSYPTARARFDGLLGRLGLAPTGPLLSVEEPSPARAGGADRVEVLRRLARGEIDLEAAEATLEGGEPRQRSSAAPEATMPSEATMPPEGTLEGAP